MNGIKRAIYAAAMVVLSAVTCHAATLVGRWTFDGTGGTGVLANKASGASWQDITLNGTGATVANGKLILPRYYNGSAWKQSYATAMLSSDMGSSAYYKEYTLVAWVEWDDFVSSYYGRLFSLSKFTGSTYNSSTVKGCQGLVWGGYSSETWRGYRVWEFLSGTTLKAGSSYAAIGGSQPASDTLVKIAIVFKQVDSSNYSQTLYADSGSGLAQVGSAAVVAATDVPAFGQCGTNCLADSTAGARYDGFGIMDLTNKVPTSSGKVSIEEIQLYSGALNIDAISTLSYAGKPHMVGQWTFDATGGTSPADNKVDSVEWEPLTISGWGAKISGGNLVLPTYQTGSSYAQSNATTMLKTDLGIGNYFKEMTQVAWVKWPGFDPTFNGRLTSLCKFTSSKYLLWNVVSGWNLSYLAENRWGSLGTYEYLNNGTLSLGNNWHYLGGSNPPTDKYVKIAQVLKYIDDSTYQLAMYWDLADGNGLVPLGNPQSIPASQVNAFGQCGTDSLVSSSGGARYDGFGIMDYQWNCPQAASEIDFDEIRLYAGALDVSDISALSSSATVASACLPTDHLIAQWTFDNRGGTSAQTNKAPDALWQTLNMSTGGAEISRGALNLSTYQSGSNWISGGASASLATSTDVFYQKTYVLWMSIDKLGDSDDYAFVFRMHSRVPDLPGDSINWNASAKEFDWRTRNASGSEIQIRPCGGSPSIIPEAGKTFKLAMSLSANTNGTYAVTFYIDLFDGNGLRQYGSTQQVDVSYVNSYGSTGNGDTIEILPGVSNLTSNTFGIGIDEFRVYDTALSAGQISDVELTEPENFVQSDGSSLTLGGREYRAIGGNCGSLFQHYAGTGNDVYMYFNTKDAARQYIVDAVNEAQQSKLAYLRFWATAFYPVEMQLYFQCPEEYWKQMDEVFALCREHNVKLVPSVLFSISMWSYIYGEDRQAIFDPTSLSYAAMHKYLREMVLRYRDDPNVAMWEIANELYLDADINMTGRNVAIGQSLCIPGSPGYLRAKPTGVLEDSFSTAMLRQYYTDIVSYIHNLDPNHLVESGDADVRAYSESLKNSFPNETWRLDTIAQHNANTLASQQMMDAFCFHMYVHSTDEANPAGLSDLDMDRVRIGVANAANKPVIAGEFGQSIPDLADDPNGTLTLGLLDTLDSAGADMMSIWTWYMPSFPTMNLINGNYPAVYARIKDYNTKHAFPEDEESLVGKWDFEGTSSSALNNKVTDIAWPIDTMSSQASISNGELKLTSSSGGNGHAYAHLGTNIPGFKEKTYVFWMSMDKLGDSDDYAFLFRLHSTDDNLLNDCICWNAGAREFEWRCRGNSYSEIWARPCLNSGGPVPATGKLFKLAVSIADNKDGNYAIDYYIDLYDGAGLRKYGQTQYVAGSYINRYGSVSNDDHVEFWPGTNGLTGDSIDVNFEEVRVYAKALTETEINALTSGIEPAIKPVVGTSIRSIFNQLMITAAANYQWVVWGKVTPIDANTFSIDDGSGVALQVVYASHGLTDGEFVSVRGSLDVSESSPVLTAIEFQKIN